MSKKFWLLFFKCFIFLVSWRSGSIQYINFIVSVAAEETLKYGVDVSFPIHHGFVSTNYNWLPHNNNNNTLTDATISTEIPPEYQGMPIQPLGNRQQFYNDLIQGCIEHYGDKGIRCELSEIERNKRCLRQPPSMYNYTKLGYTKIRAPKELMKLLNKFWETNKHLNVREEWSIGDAVTNHWEAPTYIASVNDPDLDGAGHFLRQSIWDAARDTISEWTGQHLAPCSLYGIRIYTRGAVLSHHVDRMPLVSSAIINVAQDVDEPWPLEVIGHDGIAVNVTMEPGDLVLYESHSIIHGRPFALNGSYMANIFVHFEPIGPLDQEVTMDRDLPPYVIPGTPMEEEWRSSNPHGYNPYALVYGGSGTEHGATAAHAAALFGDVDNLKQILDKVPHWIHVQDDNGWHPLHEAVREGQFHVVKYLIDRGADINARTHGYNFNNNNKKEVKNRGGSVLWIAIDELGKDHKVTRLLQQAGAEFIPPEGFVSSKMSFSANSSSRNNNDTNQQFKNNIGRQNDAHVAVQNGNLKMLQKVLDYRPEWIDSPDENGWTPLHEAVMIGNVDMVKILLLRGANVNARTSNKYGPNQSGSVLWWAKRVSRSSDNNKEEKEEEDQIETLLRVAGAKMIYPNGYDASSSGDEL